MSSRKCCRCTKVISEAQWAAPGKGRMCQTCYREHMTKLSDATRSVVVVRDKATGDLKEVGLADGNRNLIGDSRSARGFQGGRAESNRRRF